MLDDQLETGKYRVLTENEVDALKALAGLQGK